MTDEIQDITRRLVVGHKADGRCVYDEQAKAELIAACARPGASVSRLARECGINANQVSRWLREDRERRGELAQAVQPQVAFVPVTIEATPAKPSTTPMSMQARLPNGVVVDLRNCDPQQAGHLLQALGRLPCSASTSG